MPTYACCDSCVAGHTFHIPMATSPDTQMAFDQGRAFERGAVDALLDDIVHNLEMWRQDHPNVNSHHDQIFLLEYQALLDEIKKYRERP